MISPIFEMLSSSTIQNITRCASLSLVVPELIAVKFHKISKSGNTGADAYNESSHNFLDYSAGTF